MKTYKYEPLSARCIRLLSLKFDENSAPLRFSISVHSIDKPPVYKALSYVWGDASDRVEVVALDEECNECTISVTKNLHHALRRLRSGGCNQYIWADAICINQGDDKEKSTQVRMMTEIYTRTQQVLGWLGESAPGDGDGFNLLKDIVRIRRAESGDAKMRAIQRVLSPTTHASWAALWEILLRPWFRRVWIIQEIVVCNDSCLMCGEEIIRGEEFFTAFEIMATNQNIGNVFLFSATAANRERLTTSNLYEMRRSYRYSHERSIHHFLTNSGKFEATDPRDKIFALVGLSDNVDNSFIDYQLDAKSVFQRIQSLQLSIPGASTQTLGFGCLGKYFEDLPSWVCQWRIHGETDRVPLYVCYPTISPQANPVDIVHYVNGFCHLAMSAVMFDYIEECIPWTTVPSIAEETVHRWGGVRDQSQFNQDDAESVENVVQGQAEFLNKCVQLVQKLAAYPTGQNLDEVLWRAYLFDITTSGETPAPESYGDLFKKLVQCFNLLNRLDLSDPSATELPDKSPISVTPLEILILSMIFIFCWRKGVYPRMIWHWVAFVLAVPIMLFTCYLLNQLSLKWIRRLKLAMQWEEVKDGIMLADVGMFTRLREGRCFGTTRKGYVGWFPTAAEKADIVCFLKHSDVPFVLRRTKVAGIYALIGDSYIYGLMNGSRSSLADIESQRILIK